MPGAGSQEEGRPLLASARGQTLDFHGTEVKGSQPSSMSPLQRALSPFDRTPRGLTPLGSPAPSTAAWKVFLVL